MPTLETSRTTTTTLGRGSVQEEAFTQGSSTTTKGAQTTTRAEARPLLAVTETVATPEIAVAKSQAVHVGIAFQFTLKWQGGKG